jgi:predicted  nucleic acid-binding Zn-ribbon protein
MSVLLTSLQHPLQQHNQNVAQSSTSSTQISVAQSSPSTKNAKRMNRIKELEAFISTLKENKSKLSSDDPDVSRIEERLERYRKAVQNLEDEMFGTAD